jgi:hypothetical protein
MVKRTAAIAVFVLALSLAAFADSIVPTEPGGNTAVSLEYHRGKNNRPCVPVPEPASVLVFGTGLLLGCRFVKRRFSGC